MFNLNQMAAALQYLQEHADPDHRGRAAFQCGAEGGRLAAEKKSLYAQYRAAQKDMREAVAVKGNVDHLLGITEAPKNKEMTR